MKKIMFNDKHGLTQAVLEGRKTQTRRIITPQPTYKDNCGICWKGFAYGIGLINKLFSSYKDFILGTEYNKSCRRYREGEIVAVAQSYEAVFEEQQDDTLEMLDLAYHAGWRNKMFVRADNMPHQIRITDVRVERLQDISNEDCIKEGIIKKWHAPAGRNYYYVPGVEVKSVEDVHDTPREAFARLIDKVSKKGAWESNPYVWVYEFELID